MSSYNSQAKRCHVCSKITTSCCELCKTTFYCGRQHQEIDWPKHKLICTGRQQQNSESSKVGFSTAEKPVKQPVENETTARSQKGLKKSIAIVQHKSKEPKQSSNGSESSQITRTLDAIQIQRPTIEQVWAKADLFLEQAEKRKSQRRQLILDYVRAREESFLVKAASLVKLSRSIWQNFNDQISNFLYKQYRVKTSKYCQQLQYLMDSTYLCKMLIRTEQRQKLKELIFQLELPELPRKPNADGDFVNQVDMESYKLYRQEVQMYRKFISLLAAVANAAGFVNFTQKLYGKYVELVEDSSGPNQQSVAYFMVGLWYSEVQEHNKAIRCYDRCIELQQSGRRALTKITNGQVQRPSQTIVSNSYYNMALSQRMLNQVEESIQSMIRCLSIRREEMANNELQLADCLEFVGREMMQSKRLEQSIDYLNECHEIRRRLLRADEEPLLHVKELVRMLYKVVRNERLSKSSAFQHNQRLSRTQNRLTEIIKRDYPEIQTYVDKIKKAHKAKLNIKIDPEWFKTMAPDDITSFAEIVRGCQELDLNEAARYFFQSRFYTKLSEDKKKAIKELNPQLLLP